VSGEKSENNRGVVDYWVVKIDKNGNKLWDNTLGGSGSDFLFSLLATLDGGYLLGGFSFSGISGEKSEANRGEYGNDYDYWVVKLSPEVTSSPNLYRINAGGDKYTTIYKQEYKADSYFQGGIVSTQVSAPVAGTGDDYLYQRGRHGAWFSYNFPLQNGEYDVVLHFCETWWGNLVPGGVGSRKFDVDIEGARKLSESDIFQQAGDALQVRQETFRISVNDDTLDIAFKKGTADLASIKAIEVLPAGSFYRINAGGGAVTTATHTFLADTYYAHGSVSTKVSSDIEGTQEDALYQTGWHGAIFSYGLPTGVRRQMKVDN
jgi:hypothetical protein